MIVVSVPLKQAEALRRAAGQAGAGQQGRYDFTSSSIKQTGRFKPLEGANPSIGSIGKITKVREERIEFICPKRLFPKVIKAIKKVHPYQQPAIQVYPLVYPS